MSGVQKILIEGGVLVFTTGKGDIVDSIFKVDNAGKKMPISFFEALELISKKEEK